MIALIAAASYTWILATAYTDGSALDPLDISATRLQWATCGEGGTFGVQLGSVEVPTPATSYVVELPPGTYCSAAVTVLKDGRESAPSAPVQHVQKPGIDPESPTLAQTAVVVGRETYALAWQDDGHAEFVPIGYAAPRGAQCRLLNGMGIWGPYGYGVVGADIVICRGPE